MEDRKKEQILAGMIVVIAIIAVVTMIVLGFAVIQ